MINNKESEIHGCKVNVTWSRKEICTITKITVRYREIKPLGDEAQWAELKVPTTTFHLLPLECDKGMKLVCLPGLEKFKATGQFLGNLKPTLQVRHCLMYVQ